MSARINPGKASLVGGIVVGIATMVLWLAVTHELGFDSPVALGAGALVSVTVAVWTRLADL
jgi:hypothetical protein